MKSIIIRWPKLLNPTQLSQIIRVQKNPLTALRLFNEATSRYPKYRHNGPVYATMIDILADSGRVSEMKDLIHQMKRDSCQLRDSIFVTAITTYAKFGLLDDAVSLFRNLPRFNCVNWTQSFNTLLQIMVRESDFQTAHELYMDNSTGWEVRFGNKLIEMDNKHTVEMHKYLEKQSEVLMDAYRSMSHELHRLQVEEEMLMRKFYELMSAQGLTKKDKNGEDACNDGQSGAMVPHDLSNLK